MKFKFVFFLSIIFLNLSCSQQKRIIQQDSTSWDSLKNAAHQIGFCIYHSSHNHCTDHSDEFAKREKETPDDMDTYYFEMKKEWAENRLDEWSKRQEQPVENFLILFDVAQDFSLEKTKPETYNSFKGFILIDLTDSIEFVFFNKNKIIIKSDEKNALMENTLWREFMTGRLGRFSPSIDFDLIGKNAEADFENFKKAFLFFQKKK